MLESGAFLDETSHVQRQGDDSVLGDSYVSIDKFVCVFYCMPPSTFWKAKMHVISTFFLKSPLGSGANQKKNRRASGKILCLPIFCLFSVLCQACVEGCRNRLLVELLADDAEFHHAVADLLVPVLRDVRVLGEDFLLLFRACGGNPLS